VAEVIRFYMDEHFPSPATMALRRRGVDVFTTQEADRCGVSDIAQLAFATTQGRVMVTFDPDYLALHRSGTEHAGIAWCPQQKYSIGELIQATLLLHAVLDRDSMRNHVEYL
jgi:Domain of unknown function (DUF5615)